MAESDTEVLRLLEAELSCIDDPSVRARIGQLRVAPYAVERAWDYGAPGETYVCWTVIEHRAVNRGIAYCGEGFGPQNPWGLVFLSASYASIGMDSGWFPTLEEAMRDLMGWDEDDDRRDDAHGESRC